MNFSTRLFNLLLTNIPGPQSPLFMLERELTRIYPIAFLAQNHGLAVAAVSYNGTISFGLLGDREVMTDLDELNDYLSSSIEETLLAAQIAGKSRARVS
jgi:hypothetical protein